MKSNVFKVTLKSVNRFSTMSEIEFIYVAQRIWSRQLDCTNVANVFHICKSYSLNPCPLLLVKISPYNTLTIHKQYLISMNG